MMSKETTVEKWYDRKSRNWVVQKKDREGNQIGDAVYVYTRREADLVVKEFENEV